MGCIMGTKSAQTGELRESRKLTPYSRDQETLSLSCRRTHRHFVGERRVVRAQYLSYASSAERRKIRKKTKVVEQPKASGSSSATPAPEASADAGGDVEMADADKGGELEPESVYHAKEVQELDALLDPELKRDVGSSPAGLYELVGA